VTRVHTEDQGLDAIRALGYDPHKDRIMSVLITVDRISVRRLVFEAGRAIVVEDQTWIKPQNMPSFEHPDNLGPLTTTSPEAG
jgi:hypothetical protein